jgi:hypothetical protein
MNEESERDVREEENEPRSEDVTEERARAAEAAADAAGEPPEGSPLEEADDRQFGRDYAIPGVDPSDPDPYRWHTGRKRDHGGEDAIEIIDLVKQFGRTRILNGLNLGLPDEQI